MNGKFLLRLDDACPAFDSNRWIRVEELLDRLSIKPIVAVIPDNRDSQLNIRSADPSFWDRALRWQEKGWTIGLHGYQHVLREVTAKQYLPFYSRSEFAGLPWAEQREKIRLGWAILRSHGLRPTIWVAPAHSFDSVTLDALREETNIRIVSDGLARSQFCKDGFHWFPQQLWRLQNKEGGLWTVCLHPNSIDERSFSALEEDLQRFQSHIVSVNDVQLVDRSRSFFDYVETGLFWMRHYSGKATAKAGKLRRRFQ